MRLARELIDSIATSPPVSDIPGVSFQSRLLAVTHPCKIEALSDVRAAEARSAQIGRCEGVTRCFQVSRYKIEPVERARNLLSKHDCRAALLDEPVPDGPEVSVIVKSFLLARSAERLAWARSCPDRAVIRPSGIA